MSIITKFVADAEATMLPHIARLRSDLRTLSVLEIGHEPTRLVADAAGVQHFTPDNTYSPEFHAAAERVAAAAESVETAWAECAARAGGETALAAAALRLDDGVESYQFFANLARGSASSIGHHDGRRADVFRAQHAAQVKAGHQSAAVRTFPLIDSHHAVRIGAQRYSAYVLDCANRRRLSLPV